MAGFRKIWLLLLALPFLWLAPMLTAPGSFLYAPGSLFSDLTISHWPNAQLVHQTLADFGEIPLWNPTTLGGTPFAANPLSGLYYPPLWFVVAFPYPLTFNLLFLAHLALAGLGAYALARSECLPAWAALLAGAAFGGLPKFVAHVAAGHPTLVFAAAWTPWLLLAGREAWRRGNLRLAALTGLLAGAIFLVDPRWALPAGLGAAAYALAARSIAANRRRVLAAATVGILGAGITAVLAIPLAEFTWLSTRSNFSAGDMAMFSLPISQLSGLVFSNLGGSLEFVVYSGAAVLLLAGCSFFLVTPRRKNGSAGSSIPEGTPERRSYPWFWLVMLVVSVILALGGNMPVYPALARIVPGFSLLRVPARWMFFAGLSLAMLAAYGFAALSAVRTEPARTGLAQKIGFVVASAGLMLAAGAALLHLPVWLVLGGAMWGAAGAALFAACAFPRIPWGWVAAAVLLALGADLARSDIAMLSVRSTETVLGYGGEAAEYIAGLPDSADYRVYSPSYSIPQETAAAHNLRLIYGVDPLMLRSTVDVVSRASGVAADTYSVVLPPFANGKPIDNEYAIPNVELLGLLNVKYVVSDFPMVSTKLTLIDQTDMSYIYRNPLARPLAWVADSLEDWDKPSAGKAVVEKEDPNHLTIHAAGPGVLIVSQAAYPDWQARVDGVSAPVETAGGWWQSVPLDAGSHTVDLEFSPRLPLLGLAITLAAFLLAGGVFLWAK